MDKTVINFRIEKQAKEEFEAILESMGDRNVSAYIKKYMYSFIKKAKEGGGAITIEVPAYTPKPKEEPFIQPSEPETDDFFSDFTVDLDEDNGMLFL